MIGFEKEGKKEEGEILTATTGRWWLALTPDESMSHSAATKPKTGPYLRLFKAETSTSVIQVVHTVILIQSLFKLESLREGDDEDGK